MPPFPPLSPPPPGSRPLAASFTRPPAPPASSTFELTASFILEPTRSPPLEASFVGLALEASFVGLGVGRLPLERPASEPFFAASGAGAARPAPAATPFAPDSGLDFFLLGATLPAFFKASRATLVRASRTVSLTSRAMFVSSVGFPLRIRDYPPRPDGKTVRKRLQPRIRRGARRGYVFSVRACAGNDSSIRAVRPRARA